MPQGNLSYGFIYLFQTPGAQKTFGKCWLIQWMNKWLIQNMGFDREQMYLSNDLKIFGEKINTKLAGDVWEFHVWDVTQILNTELVGQPFGLGVTGVERGYLSFSPLPHLHRFTSSCGSTVQSWSAWAYEMDYLGLKPDLLFYSLGQLTLLPLCPRS